MKINKATIVKIIVGLIIGSGLIYFLNSKMHIEDVYENIKSADITFLLIAIFFSFLSHVSRGLRWHILLEDQGIKAPKIGLIAATYFGYFVNIIIPRGGEISRCSAISYKYGLPTDKLIGTVVLERVIDFFMLLSCVFLVTILNYDTFGEYMSLKLNDLIVLLETIKYILFIGLILGLIGAVLLYKNRKKNTIMMKVSDFVSGSIEGLKSLQQLQRRGLFIFHTFFIWLMYLLMSYIPFYSFHETKGLSFVEGMFTFVLGGIGMTVPSPGGVGSYQLIVSQGMTEVLGVSESTSMAYAWSVWGILTIFTLVMGVFVSIYLFKGKRYVSSKEN